MIFLVISYLIGSIPTGFLVARWCGIDDIRKYGSGNIGATNVARILGTHFFFLVFTLDCFKAYAWLKFLDHYALHYDEKIVAAIAVLVGNGCSIFLGGKGGKGAATSVGVLLALHPTMFFYSAITWVSILAWTKTVGIASACALFSLPFFSFFICADTGITSILILFIACWGIWLHRDNIRRFQRAVGV